MPRPTYRTRLEVLINNPAISARDKSFAQSLLSYYERKGRLSAGRVKWVATLEERYSPEKLLAATEKHKTFLMRLDALSMRCEPSSWAAGFVESLISQVKGDRRLSDRPHALHYDLGDRASILFQCALPLGLRDIAIPLWGVYRAGRCLYPFDRRPRECRYHLGPVVTSTARAARYPDQRVRVSFSRRAVLLELVLFAQYHS